MKFYISLPIIILLISCNKEVRYKDFDKSDFNQVQGLIISAVPDSYPFNSHTVKNIRYKYQLDRNPPRIGFENIDMFEAQRGYPLIVLVHKSNPEISFYGRVGILDSLNEIESAILKKHFQNEIEKLK